MPRGVYERTEAIRQKISFACLGKYPTEEIKQKLSIAKSGKNHPFYGKHRSKEVKKKLRLANLGKHHSEETKEKMRLSHLGKNYTEEARENMRKAQLGKHYSEETLEKMRISHLKENLTDETLKKMSESQKGKHNFTKEQLKKILHRRIPTSLEEKFQSIVDKHNLPYKYVGNGSFIIGRYNPDFINTNSEKIAVEVYARYYKKRNHDSIEDWKIQRSEVFKQYGWQIMYFNEIEVNEENILNKLLIK